MLILAVSSSILRKRLSKINIAINLYFVSPLQLNTSAELLACLFICESSHRTKVKCRIINTQVLKKLTSSSQSGNSQWGTEGEVCAPKDEKRQNQDENKKKRNEKGQNKKKTSRKGTGEKNRDREKHKDVNGKVLDKKVEHCIHRTTNCGRSLLYGTCHPSLDETEFIRS